MSLQVFPNAGTCGARRFPLRHYTCLSRYGKIYRIKLATRDEVTYNAAVSACKLTH